MLNADLERSLLSYILKSPTYFSEVIKHCNIRDFKVYPELFRIVCDYFSNYNKLPSHIALQDIVKGKNDEKLLAASIDLSLNAVNDGEFTFYLDKFVNYSNSNRLLEVMESALDDIRAGNGTQAIEKVYNSISQINNTKTDAVVDAQETAMQRLEEYMNPSHIITIPTGISRIDRCYGGFRPGELSVIIAPTGGGKSVFLQNVAVNAWLGGKRVIFVTLEIPAGDMYQRIDSQLTQIPYSKFLMKDMTATEKDVCKQKLLQVYSNKNGYLKVVDIARGCTPLVLESSIYNYLPSADLLVVDYMGEMISTKKDKDWEAQGDIALALKQIGRQWNIPVVTAAQVNKEGANGEFDITNISRSWLIANRSDFCFAWQRIGEAEILFKALKARRGQRYRFKMICDFARMTIRDLPESQDDFGIVNENDISGR